MALQTAVAQTTSRRIFITNFWIPKVPAGVSNYYYSGETELFAYNMHLNSVELHKLYTNWAGLDWGGGGAGNKCEVSKSQ